MQQLEAELLRSESARVAQLRTDFNVAFDCATEIAGEFRQALHICDRLSQFAKKAGECLNRDADWLQSHGMLSLDEMFRWEEISSQMTRVLCKSSSELRALRSAQPSMQNIARLRYVTGVRNDDV